MTALDRSFIKAYDKRPQAGPAVSGHVERPAQTIPTPHFFRVPADAKPPATHPSPVEQVSATAEMQRENGTVTLRFDIPSQFMSFDHRPHVVEADAPHTDESKGDEASRDEARRDEARSKIASILAELAEKPLASNRANAERAADLDRDAKENDEAEVAIDHAPAVAVEQREAAKPNVQSAPTHVPTPQPEPESETFVRDEPDARLDASPPHAESLYGGAHIIRIDTAHVPVAKHVQIVPSVVSIHETIDVETLPSRLRVEPAPAPAAESMLAPMTLTETDANDDDDKDEPKEDATAPEELRGNDTEEHATWTRPAFEVDQFVWPDVCQMMSERAAAELATVANEVWKRAKSGRNTVAVVGNRPRQGRTSLTLCLARRLAEMDLRVAVVDGNFNHPAVAGTLGVATQIGWDDAIANHLAVSEALIESIDDRLTIVPLRSNRSRAIVEQGENSFPAVIYAVRSRFDVVLVDLAACSTDRSPSWLQRESGIDWAVVMGDCDAHTDHGIAELVRKLSDAGVKPIGIVEHELLA